MVALCSPRSRPRRYRTDRSAASGLDRVCAQRWSQPLRDGRLSSNGDVLGGLAGTSGAGCLQERSPDGRRDLDRDEAIGGEEIVLTALVDDAEIPIPLSLVIGQDRVDLVALERCLVSVVTDTQTANVGLGAALRLVEVPLALEFLLAGAVRFIPTSQRGWIVAGRRRAWRI